MGQKISICIPAYKRINYLKRLLDSICIQSFTDYEIIISDDSNDNSVVDFLKQYAAKIPIVYYKNNPAKGTPQNWNAAIAAATGEWIKLMHDDDWFSSPDSLAEFIKHTNGDAKFIFCAYNNVPEEKHKSKKTRIFQSAIHQIMRKPEILMLNNLIGPPSVTLIHNSIKQKYDQRFKWRVDIEYYISILKQRPAIFYIAKDLINIGISESQVTQSCINNPSVELPEAFILIQKNGLKNLKSIKIYDQWWRLMRNMRIESKEQLQQYVTQDWPDIIQAIVKDLSITPKAVYKSGIISKLYMMLSYWRNFPQIKKL